MGSSSKAHELRVLLGLAIKLRILADASDDLADMELFLSAALALEERANRMAFGGAEISPGAHRKVNLIC